MNFWGLKDDKKIRKLRFEALEEKIWVPRFPQIVQIQIKENLQ